MTNREPSQAYDTEQSRYRSGNYSYEDQLYKIGTGATLFHDPREQGEQVRTRNSGPPAGRGPKNYVR